MLSFLFSWWCHSKQHKLFNFDESNSSVFPFVNCAFDVSSEVLCNPRLQIFIPMFTSLVAQKVKCVPKCGRPEFNSWVGKISWRREWQPTPVVLPPSKKRGSKKYRGFPCSSLSKESSCSAGDLGSIPGLGRSPGEGNGNPLQYPCLENLMDRGAWWAAVHEVTKSLAWLSD